MLLLYLDIKMKSDIIVDLKKIVYCKYLLPYASTSIVIVHGFSEYKERYKEAVKLFLAKGFNVYVLDLPGHGESDGHLENKYLYHIDKFDDYVFTVKRFINDVVKRDSQNKIVIYSHSMGGLISTLLLEENQNLANALILSMPMLKIKVNLPDFFVSILSNVMSKIFPKNKVFGKKNNEKAPTWKWLNESFNAEKKALCKDNAMKINVPILVLEAGKDEYVENFAIDTFASYFKNIKKLIYPEAVHEVYRIDGKIRDEYFNDIFNFLRLHSF